MEFLLGLLQPPPVALLTVVLALATNLLPGGVLLTCWGGVLLCWVPSCSGFLWEGERMEETGCMLEFAERMEEADPDGLPSPCWVGTLTVPGILKGDCSMRVLVLNSLLACAGGFSISRRKVQGTREEKIL